MDRASLDALDARNERDNLRAWADREITALTAERDQLRFEVEQLGEALEASTAERHRLQAVLRQVRASVQTALDALTEPNRLPFGDDGGRA